MWQIIAWELRHRRQPLIWWTIGSLLMTLLIIALFPSIRDQAAQMNEVLNQMPAELRGMKSGGSTSVDVGNPLEYLNSQVFYMTLPLIWIIWAITRGSGILGKEEQTRTIELLLARPITRTVLLISKAIAFMLEGLIIAFITILGLVLFAPIFELSVGTSRVLMAGLYTALFSFSFGYIAFSLQATSQLTKRGAATIATLVGFGGYLLVSLSTLTDWLATIVKFFPYHYFQPLNALQGSTPVGLVIYLIAVFGIGTIVSIYGFRRRDIAG